MLIINFISIISGEHVYDLAMNLHLLKTCFPKWPEVSRVSKEVLEVLKRDDQQLYDHMIHISEVEFTIEEKVKEMN